MAHDLATGGEHPDVLRWRGEAERQERVSLTAESLRALMLDCGADDCGFVAVADPAIADQQAWISALLPNAQTLVSFVCRMNRDTVRTSVRSVANEEFHQTYDDVNHVARRAVRRLEEMGIGAVNPAAAFPMEAQAYPAGMRVISHKPIAEAAGMDGEAFMAKITEEPIKRKLFETTDEIIAREGFGSPTFFIDEDDMYFGNDRLELMQAAIDGK